MEYSNLFTEWYKLIKQRSIEWNKRKLPCNTETMQLKKVVEEVLEAIEEPYSVEEKADVLISIFGVSRFDSIKGIILEKAFWELCDAEHATVIEIIIAAGKKLDILETREYEIKNGVYHH